MVILQFLAKCRLEPNRNDRKPALAASLYQILITDQAWSLAREKMGYTTPVAQPLMVMLAGQPFIDVQLSLISFLPKAIRRRCIKIS